uniref:Uncharacterized protein n=1 Tax=Macrostomum lignano TaxID=282301 RepID=A0A1I8I0C3_9PLAT
MSSHPNEKGQQESGDESKETGSCGPPQGEEIVLRNSSHGGAVSDASSGRESKCLLIRAVVTVTLSLILRRILETTAGANRIESSSNGQQQRDEVRRRPRQRDRTRPWGLAGQSQLSPQTAGHDMASDMPSQSGPNGNST